MMELVVSGGVPMGDIRLFLIAFGAILGAFAGILVGRYNIYIKLNKTNNFASDEEYKRLNDVIQCIPKSSIRQSI